ncbi:IniB N-terminal domain-containing protein [Actinoplanes sp. NPDC026619]|uniref:IniB N-terminal domain-containing protein n=1 Tax=Actinoplanes sp. NPDC026619 TaxID=3155798 RepID=UPI0033F83546
MESSPTLQDFVLNLIYDPVARDAFEVDPHGTLQEAGLGDVTAADVQDVLPLVLDFAPLQGLSSIDGVSQVDSLTTGVANLDIAGAAAHLQTITAQLGGTASHVTGDLNVAAAGAVTVTADHLVSGVLGGGLSFHGDGGNSGFHGAGGLDSLGGFHGIGGLFGQDPGAGLDAGVAVTAPVDHHAVTDVTYGVESVVPHVSAGLTGSLDTTVNTVTGSIDLDVSGVHGATSSVVGSVLGPDLTGGLLPDSSVVDSTISGVDHSVSGVLGGVTGTVAPDHAHDGHGLLGGLAGLDF